MTDFLKEIDTRLGALKNGLLEEMQVRQDAATEEIRKSSDARIKALEDAIAKAEITRADAQRVALPGVEYAKKGEPGKFSLFRAMQLSVARDTGDHAGLWRSKEFGYEVEAIEEVRKALQSMDPKTKASMNIGTDAAGGVFVPTSVMVDSIIPELESAAIVYQLGATRVDGLVGTFNWPVDQGGTTAYYIDTEAEEAVTTSQNSFATLAARPHTMGAATTLTRGMLKQSAISMEQFVRSAIVRKFALKEDYTALFGTGTNGEPRGITNLPSSATNTAINWTSADFAGADQTATARVNDMIYAPLIANYTNPAARWGWAARPEVGKKLANATDADGRPLFQAGNVGVLNTLAGYPFRTQTQSTAATSDEFFLYGDWSQLLMLHWGVMEFRTGFTGSNMLADVLTVMALMDHDVLIRQGKAFVAGDNFTTT